MRSTHVLDRAASWAYYCKNYAFQMFCNIGSSLSHRTMDSICNDLKSAIKKIDKMLRKVKVRITAEDKHRPHRCCTC